MAGQPPFHQRAERDRLDPPVRPVAVKLAEHGVQRVAALPRVTGGTERERQLEEQRRPLLLRPGPLGKQPERRLQPLRGRPRCLRLDGAGRLGQQADRAEVTELGRPLDVIGLLGQRGAAVPERGGGLAVRTHPPGGIRALVDRAPDDGVAEGEQPGRLDRADQIRRGQLADRGGRAVGLEPRDLADGVDAEGVADHGGRSCRQLPGRGQRQQLRDQGRGHGRRELTAGRAARFAIVGGPLPLGLARQRIQVERVTAAGPVDGAAP